MSLFSAQQSTKGMENGLHPEWSLKAGLFFREPAEVKDAWEAGKGRSSSWRNMDMESLPLRNG
jgi:hypothetical protein